jgi:hypothetical protein
MSTKTPVGVVAYPGWVGGINRDADPYQLEPTESPDALNVDFGLRGAVSSRGGYVEWDDTPPSAGRSMFVWDRPVGGKILYYVAANGAIYSGTGSPLSTNVETVGTVSASIDYQAPIANLNGKTYFTSPQAEGPYSHDGSTWTELGEADFDGSAGDFPRAAFLAVHHQRMFAANVWNSSDVRFPSAVYWSEVDDPETWESTSFIDFSPESGAEITGLVQYAESLVVFTRSTVQMLTGKSPLSFARFVLEQQLGTDAPGTIVSVGGQLIFFDPRTGVWAFDGAGFVEVDEPISVYLRTGINFSNRHKCVAWFSGNRYYLSVPWGASTTPSRTFVRDMRTGAWSEYDYGVTAAVLWDEDVLGSSPRSLTGVYTLNSGTNDDGVAIESYLRTGWMTPSDTPLALHRLRRLDTVWGAVANATVTLEAYLDFDTISPAASYAIDTDPGGFIWGTSLWGDLWGPAVEELMARVDGLNFRWRAIQFRVVVDALDDAFELNRMAAIYSSGSRIRGID